MPLCGENPPFIFVIMMPTKMLQKMLQKIRFSLAFGVRFHTLCAKSKTPFLIVKFFHVVYDGVVAWQGKCAKSLVYSN